MQKYHFLAASKSMELLQARKKTLKAKPTIVYF